MSRSPAVYAETRPLTEEKKSTMVAKLINWDDVMERFTKSPEFESPITLGGSDIGTETGVDLLAFAARGILEAGVCTRVACIGLGRYELLFRQKYASMFRAAGLNLSDDELGLLISGKPQKGSFTACLRFNDFLPT